jgi:hypothetical protein
MEDAGIVIGDGTTPRKNYARFMLGILRQIQKTQTSQYSQITLAIISPKWRPDRPRRGPRRKTDYPPHRT